MTTATRNTKAGQIERRVHIERTCIGIRATISEYKGRKTRETPMADRCTVYILRRIESQIGGIGVEVEKLGTGGEVYHTLLHTRHGHECSCPWGTYKPNAKPCKHIVAALEAHERGML